MGLSLEAIDRIRRKMHILEDGSLRMDLLNEKNGPIFEEDLIKLWQSYINDNQTPNICLYVHTPFCLLKKCNFCTYSLDILTDQSELDEYLDKLETQAKLFSSAFGRIKFSSLYLGGGTASIYSIDQLRRIYGIIFDNFRFLSNVQFNHEFSFKTMDEQKLNLALKRGFNKFSFGIHSFNKEVLKLANAEYPDMAKIKKLIGIVSERKNASISCDLISGLPGDTIEGLSDSIRNATRLDVNYIIVYPFLYSGGLISRIKKAENICKEYSEYIAPYSTKDIKRTIEILSREIAGWKFTFQNEAIIIANMGKRDTQMNFISYYNSTPRFASRNSVLGLGKGAYSFIELKYWYKCMDFGKFLLYSPNHELTSCKKDLYDKLIFIIDSLTTDGKIDTQSYKKLFSASFDKDFAQAIGFLKDNNLLLKEGDHYLPICSSNSDMINIKLSFIPEEHLRKFLG